MARRYQQSTREQAGPQRGPDDHGRAGAPGLSPACGVGLHGARRGQGTESPKTPTVGCTPLPQGHGRTINCTVTPLLRCLGRRGSPAGLAPTANPEPSRVGLPPHPGTAGPLGGETGLGGGRGVVTAAWTRGWGQDGVSSPRYPPTPQDEQPGVCSQISPAWAPRAHPTGTPPPLPTARPVLRSFDAPGKGGCQEAPQPRADLKRLVAWTLRETQENPSNNPGSHRPRAPGEGPGAWRRRHTALSSQKGGTEQDGGEGRGAAPAQCTGSPSVGHDRETHQQQGRTGRKAPRHTLTQAFTSMCAGTRVREVAPRGWTGGGQGRQHRPARGSSRQVPGLRGT